MKRLKKISSPIRRARFVHKEVTKSMETLFEDPVVKEHVTCKKGCSACCHTQVSVTKDEADLLAKLILDGATIDVSLLHMQANAWTEASSFDQVPHGLRKCIFLDSASECIIYEDRPSVCRTNSVVSDPANCSTVSGIQPEIQLLKTFDADMQIIGSYIFCEENGTLPEMVKVALDKLIDSKREKTHQDNCQIAL